MVYCVVDPYNLDQRDMEGILLLDLKSHTDTINTKGYCQMLQAAFEDQELTSG